MSFTCMVHCSWSFSGVHWCCSETQWFCRMWQFLCQTQLSHLVKIPCSTPTLQACLIPEHHLPGNCQREVLFTESLEGTNTFPVSMVITIRIIKMFPQQIFPLILEMTRSFSTSRTLFQIISQLLEIMLQQKNIWYLTNIWHFCYFNVRKSRFYTRPLFNNNIIERHTYTCKCTSISINYTILLTGGSIINVCLPLVYGFVVVNPFSMASFSSSKCIRAAACKYRESQVISKISKFVLVYQNIPYVELFQKISFKRLSDFFFRRNLQKFQKSFVGRFRADILTKISTKFRKLASPHQAANEVHTSPT